MLGIVERRNALGGFVEEDVVALFGVEHGFVVDFDATFARNDERAHFCDDAPAHFDAPCRYHFFCMTTACHAC